MNGQKDQEKLLEHVLETNKQRLSAIARSFAPDENRDDLLQEIQIQIWRSLGSFNGQARIDTWVYSVAINTATKFKRQLRNSNYRKAAFPEEGTFNRATTTAPNMEAHMLEEFIRSLEDADRSVFLLFLEKLTYRDISEVVGIDENHLRVKISRIKKKFIERYIGR